MGVVLGIIIGVLILAVFFIVAAEVKGDNKIKVLQARQESLNRELNVAKDQYQRRMEDNNKEIAKELEELHRNSTYFMGIGQRVAISDLLAKFMQQLGYDVIGREFKIIKKGDQGSYGEGKEREETKRSTLKKKES